MDAEESAADDDGHILMRLQGDLLIVVTSVNDAPTQHFCCLVSKTRELLEQEPLTEVKVESAIAQIEEQIMPITRTLPAHLELKISGYELGRIHGLFSKNNNRSIPIESVESLFNQLADYAGGVPFAWHYSLSPIEAALGLISLREVMHHGGFKRVSQLNNGE